MARVIERSGPCTRAPAWSGLQVRVPLLVRHESGAEAAQREGQPVAELTPGPLPGQGRSAAAAKAAQHTGRRGVLSQQVGAFHDVKVCLPHSAIAGKGRAVRALAHLAVAVRDGLNARVEFIADATAQALACMARGLRAVCGVRCLGRACRGCGRVRVRHVASVLRNLAPQAACRAHAAPCAQFGQAPQPAPRPCQTRPKRLNPQPPR